MDPLKVHWVMNEGLVGSSEVSEGSSLYIQGERIGSFQADGVRFSFPCSQWEGSEPTFPGNSLFIITDKALVELCVLDGKLYGSVKPRPIGWSTEVADYKVQASE